jgi:hypothetical protein
MVGFRLSEDYERRLEELAKAANLTPGTLARRVVIAFIETQEDSQGLVSDRLSRIEKYMVTQGQSIMRLEKRVQALLENIEVVDGVM